MTVMMGLPPNHSRAFTTCLALSEVIFRYISSFNHPELL